MALVSNPKSGDDVSVRQAIARLGSSKLGPKSSPKFLAVNTTSLITTTLTISGLTTNSLVYPVAGLFTSLGVAANGKIPIGSTGVAPVLAEITGTANQITSTPGAGSITLSTPQDIHTTASNFTVAGATVSGLTASRLMRSDGSKVLSSVSSLTAWIAGTTDRISVADDGDGSVTLDLATNIQTAISLNTTHRSSDGSDHSIVGSNTTAIGLNTTHRTSNGSNHSFLDQAVTIASTPTLAGLIIANGGTIGQAAGPLLTFDDTGNDLNLTGGDFNVAGKISIINPLVTFNLLSGDINKWCAISIGRAAIEGYWAMTDNFNVFFQGVVAGDMIWRLNDDTKTIHFGAGDGTSVASFTISAAGIVVNGNANVTGVYKVDDTQVVSNQAAAILDATDAASVIIQLNDLLAKLRTHGIIAN